MQQSSIWKTTIREIRQSLGRYLAILAIIALGVGFFAGLKVTKPSMVKTVEKYLEENALYDLRLLSTLGFEEQDVTYFQGRHGVASAQGAVSFDILYENESGSERVIKAHSLTDGVNGVVLTAGRMPESGDECVVDSRLYSADQVGEKILLSDSNAQEDLENFAYREYTIVGVVKSSLYIQFERGNTSLGNGTISGFMYLLPEGFAVDYYTEIYVKLEKNFSLYGDEYEDYMEEKEPEWETYLDIAVSRRYNDILEEARTALADAREEFEIQKADAEEQLEDARQQLLDAETELADGRFRLEDAREELTEGKKTLQERETELLEGEQALLDAEQQLAENAALLVEKEKELADGWDQWNAARDQLAEKRGELNSAEAQLNAVTDQLMGFLDKLEQLEQAVPDRDTIESGVQDVIDGVSSGDIDSLPEDWSGDSFSEIFSQEDLAVLRDLNITDAAGLKAAVQSYLDAAEQIGEGKKQLDAADAQLSYAKSQLESGERQIEDGKVQLEEGRQQIEEARAELEDGKRQIREAKKTLSDGDQELADAERELTEGEEEYEDGLREYEDGVEEFNAEIADAQAQLADAEQKISEMEAPESYVLGRDTNVGYVCFESDSSIVEDISNVFPVFFFLVAAMVCMTTMNRMVEEQRTQIGTLKALGYSDGVIMSKYLFYSGSAALGGCLTGFALGTLLFPKVIWATYGVMYELTPLKYVFDWKLALISLAVSLLCSAGTTWISCRNELAEVAAQLMRPKAPKVGKRVFLEYIPFLWKRLKFLRKVSVRNVLRYKKRFFMMVIGIGGCTALVLTGFGIKDSIADVVTQQYEEIQIDDMSVGFQKVPEESALEAFEETIEDRVAACMMTMEISMDLSFEDNLKSVYVVVPREPEQIGSYLKLHTVKGEEVAFPAPGEAVITHKMAEDFGICVGDTITLTDSDQHKLTAVVSGISQNFIYNYVYLAPETYASQLREPEYKTAHILLAEGEDVHQLSADIMKLDGISTVTVNEDSVERFSGMMASLDYIVVVVILCAAALAFIVLYNLTNINITERVREIATIKVLGFYRRETSQYVFRENMILTAVGIVAGIPLGKLLHTFVMSCINIDMVAFDVRIRGISYLYSVVLTFLFAWLVDRMMAGKLEKISMTESLKSVD